MKTKTLLPIIALMIVLATVFVSAGSVTTSLFFDSTTSDSFRIIDGNSEGFSVSADSVLETGMDLKVDLLDSNGNLVSRLLDVYTTSDSYYNHLSVGKTIYSNPGNYTIRARLTGNSGQLSTDDLYLEVVSSTPGNNVPVITSSPVIEVNESMPYSYQVIATDADGDPLTYSLTQAPSNPAWLSVSSTGLISGVAPSVVSDYVYALTLSVSDGKDSAIQTFALTVKDTNQGRDTTAPFITINSPQEGLVYNTNSIALSVTTNEPVTKLEYILSGTSIPMTLSSSGTNTFSGIISLNDGNHGITFYATDIAGNVGTNTVSFRVDTTISDTVPPVITVVSPVNNQIYTTNSVNLMITSNEMLSSARYSVDGGVNVSFNDVLNDNFNAILTLADGIHTVQIYGTDMAGNVGRSQTISFSVNTNVGDTVPPVITVVSPVNNQIYTTNSVNLMITSNEMLSSARYSVDGGVNVSFDDVLSFNWETNLILPNGNYVITVYGTDMAGNVGTTTVSFTVNKSSSGGGDRDKKKSNNISNPEDEQNYLNQFNPISSRDEVIDAMPLKTSSFWQGPGIWILGGGILILLLALIIFWLMI